MQKVLSWVFIFLAAGLFFTVFLYLATIIIPFLLLVVLSSFLWLRYKQRKALKLTDDYNAQCGHRSKKGEIIDVEYEIIDEDKR